MKTFTDRGIEIKVHNVYDDSLPKLSLTISDDGLFSGVNGVLTSAQSRGFTIALGKATQYKIRNKIRIRGKIEEAINVLAERGFIEDKIMLSEIKKYIATKKVRQKATPAVVSTSSSAAAAAAATSESPLKEPTRMLDEETSPPNVPTEKPSKSAATVDDPAGFSMRAPAPSQATPLVPYAPKISDIPNSQVQVKIHPRSSETSMSVDLYQGMKFLDGKSRQELVAGITGELQPIIQAIMDNMSLEEFQRRYKPKDAQESDEMSRMRDTNSGGTPIHFAAIVGRIDLLDFLSHFFDFHSPGFLGLPVIDCAAIAGAGQAIMYLIERGCAGDKVAATFEVKATDDARHPYEVMLSPFHMAVLTGNIECIKAFFSGTPDNINWKIDGFGNVLHLAILRNSPIVLQYLLTKLGDRAGNLLSEKTPDGFSVLSFAAVIGEAGATSLFALLQYYKTNGNPAEKHRDQSPLLALCHAINVGNYKAVYILIGSGVNPGQALQEEFLGETQLRPIDLAKRKRREHPDVHSYVNNQYYAMTAAGYRQPNLRHTIMDNLALAGGGVKSIACVGGLIALDYYLHQRAIRDGVSVPKEYEGLACIKRVSGTSAGAICACLLAIGYNPTELARTLWTMDFKSFVEGLNTRQLLEGSFLRRLTAIAEQIGVDMSYLHPLRTIEQLVDCAGLCPGNVFREYLEKLVQVKLKQNIDSDFRVKNILGKKKNLAYLTFGELRSLVVAAPDKYKHLHVIASLLKDGEKDREIVTFHSEQAPRENDPWANVLVVDAVRASMSIPGVFVPYSLREIDPQNPDGELLNPKPTVRYVDGGILKVFPVEAFDSLRYLSLDLTSGNPAKEVQNPYTLGLRLVSEDARQEGGQLAAARATFGQHIKQLVQHAAEVVKHKAMKPITDEVQHVIGSEIGQLLLETMHFYGEAEKLLADYQNAWAGRTIDIGNAGISTLKFDLTSEEKKNLLIRGIEVVGSYFDLSAIEIKQLVAGLDVITAGDTVAPAVVGTGRQPPPPIDGSALSLAHNGVFRRGEQSAAASTSSDPHPQ